MSVFENLLKEVATLKMLVDDLRNRVYELENANKTKERVMPENAVGVLEYMNQFPPGVPINATAIEDGTDMTSVQVQSGIGSLIRRGFIRQMPTKDGRKRGFNYFVPITLINDEENSNGTAY